MAGRPFTLEPGEELIESRVGIHDSNHFEVKLDYSVDSRRKKNRYRIEGYFFIPMRFGLTEHTYSSEQFYGDMQAFIRFKTPQFSLAALRDPESKRAPLTRARSAAIKAKKNPTKSSRHERIGYELRMFGALLRANLRNRVHVLEECLQQNGNSREDVVVQCTDLCDELPKVLHAFRDFASEIADPVIEGWVREAYQAVDEYVSLMVEEYLTRIIYRVDNENLDISECRTDLAEIVSHEQQHRRNRDYVLVSEHAEENEYMTYRRTQLKDFVMSVLMLEFDKAAKEGRAVREITGAIAAGAAMLFAVSAAIAAQQIWGVNTWPFVLAAVISYIFKDRIKDGLKRIMSSRFSRFLSDYQMGIRDPLYSIDIGKCRETFLYVDSDRIDPEIMALRHREYQGSVFTSTKRETVFKYIKDVVLDGRIINEHHHRVSDINDIIRFNVSHFLARSDDPMARYRVYDSKKDRAVGLSMPRVYHLNVVFALYAHGRSKPTLQRVRVVLDRNGIRRLEEP